MPIHAVIFDLGGVLVRTEERAPRAALAARLGMSYDELVQLVFDSQSALKASLGEITAAQHWEAVGAALDLSPDQLQGVRRDFFGGDRLDEALVGFIRALRPRLKTGLLSNAWSDLRHYLENYWHVVDAFDDLVISAEVGLAKPDARIYRLAVDRLGVAPEQAIFVDDYLENVDGARAAGLYAIHFRGLEQSRAELDRILEDSP
jgi:epoxide hydrolase-like predicted phosphatase